MLVTFSLAPKEQPREDWELDVVPRVGERVFVESFSGVVQSVSWAFVAPDKEESPKARAYVVLV